MNETLLTVVGNVATTPVFRELPTGPVSRFRLAVTPRRFDRVRNEWVDGHTNFFTVWANGPLGAHVQGSITIGEPVIVQGRLKVRDEERGGQHWTSADIQAITIGHDLSRGTSAFRRAVRKGTPMGAEHQAQQALDEPSFEIEPEAQPVG
ncbi:single-stranded DNA-binding protein [Streptomyces sp. SID8379]|uniref:single-stranded DNA-binding protein n=1 Tax=unclassified Streptomyces TaxID=2593676 RepID=UPI000380564C|nr:MULTISPECIES: single-stranded DNA-binding protein [unclassified Streptomyces]MYW65807.1 single-stranded DNA-binding protein [Streptomyces sp. SID8379]